MSDIETGFTNRQQTLVTCLDNTAAFNNAWRRSILKGLINRNWPAYLTRIISSFLNERGINISSTNSSHTKLMSTLPLSLQYLLIDD